MNIVEADRSHIDAIKRAYGLTFDMALLQQQLIAARVCVVRYRLLGLPHSAAYYTNILTAYQELIDERNTTPSRSNTDPD